MGGLGGLGVRGGLGGQTGVSAQRGFSGAGAGGGHTGLRGNGGAEGNLRASLEGYNAQGHGNQYSDRSNNRDDLFLLIFFISLNILFEWFFLTYLLITSRWRCKRGHCRPCR